MTNNRNPIKQWEITFPQSGDVSKSHFIENLPPYDYVICCTEAHESGDPHLHCGIKLKKGISTSKLVKWFTFKYPDDWKRIHFSAIRSWGNFCDYCRKEDPDVLEKGALENSKKIPTFLKEINLEREKESAEQSAFCDHIQKLRTNRLQRMRARLEAEGEELASDIMDDLTRKSIIDECMACYECTM